MRSEHGLNSVAHLHVLMATVGGAPTEAQGMRREL